MTIGQMSRYRTGQIMNSQQLQKALLIKPKKGGCDDSKYSQEQYANPTDRV
jgi:hypothetical protein